MHNDNEDFPTGAQSGGGGGRWLQINGKNAPHLFLKDGDTKKEMDGFAGFLTGFNIEWDEGDRDKQIAPGFRYILRFEAKDAETDKMMTYNCSFGANLSIITPEMLNVLYNIPNQTWPTSRWWLYFRIYKLDGQKSARIFISNNPRDMKERAKASHTWNTALKGYDGVPKARDTGAKDNFGEPIMDFSEVKGYWHSCALAIYEAVNGRKYSGGETKAPAPAPQVVDERNPTTFWRKAGARLEKTTEEGLRVGLLECLKSCESYGETKDRVLARFNEKLATMPGNEANRFDLTGAIKTVAESQMPLDDDDLPF